MKSKKFNIFGILIIAWLLFLGISTAVTNLQAQSATAIPIANLLTNSGFGVWSQSDTNKGISRPCAVDSGSTVPTVGETATGAISGAVGKVICMTGSGGNWGAGTGTGTLYLGACAGRFQDNEDLNGSISGANFCTINMPDSAAGVDLVQNGEFETATTGWAGENGTLASIAGGQVGNCLELTMVSGAYQAFKQTIVLTAGKLYKISFWVKSGTSGNEAFTGYWGAALGVISGTSSASWVQYTSTFEASGAGTLFIYKATATAGTMLFDEVSLYEITPGCTAADIVAIDGWYKEASNDIYRQHNDGGTLTKDGSFYAVKIVPGSTEDYVVFPLFDIRTKAEWYQQFTGRTVSFGAWVKTSTASHARLKIYDGNYTDSSYHTGGGGWEWLEVTDAISAIATSIFFAIWCDASPAVNGDTIVYVSQPMLVFGSSIGDGNYSAPSGEWIYFEKYATSNKYNNTTGWSDTAYADLNLEADSDAVIPKGTKAILAHLKATDSGSGALVDVHIHLRANATTGKLFALCWGGKTDNVEEHLGGMQPCDSNGDIQVEIEASGAGTLNILEFRYVGVQVR